MYPVTIITFLAQANGNVTTLAGICSRNKLWGNLKCSFLDIRVRWKFTKVIYPEGNMNVCARFRYPSRLFIQNHKCQPQRGARGTVRGSTEQLGFILWWTWMSVQNVLALHPVVVDQLTDNAIWSHTASVAKNTQQETTSFLPSTF